MRPSLGVHLLLVASLAVTSSAFDFNGVENDVLQTAGTVAPAQDTGANGFGALPMQSGGGQKWGTQGVECSGSGDGGGGGGGWGGGGWGGGGWGGGGGQQWGTQGVECSGSSDGGGGQQWGTQGVECSGSASDGRG
ncbi:hypothetical protein JM18_008502 [Phytophthora kernoviae]|uniref:Uncharacterized protein n=1 Tax=Phytophthora kernoviae TaxID=325452 RepID=A0A8T0LLU8_9STRA|nr:hypothetical protein JM16_008491 [Phytophthora kernoviae]KAG2512934.1 hypothetical protein JM18_008502 [Phytophthora kernoviae]